MNNREAIARLITFKWLHTILVSHQQHLASEKSSHCRFLPKKYTVHLSEFLFEFIAQKKTTEKVQKWYVIEN